MEYSLVSRNPSLLASDGKLAGCCFAFLQLLPYYWSLVLLPLPAAAPLQTFRHIDLSGGRSIRSAYRERDNDAQGDQSNSQCIHDNSLLRPLRVRVTEMGEKERETLICNCTFHKNNNRCTHPNVQMTFSVSPVTQVAIASMKVTRPKLA